MRLHDDIGLGPARRVEFVLLLTLDMCWCFWAMSFLLVFSL